MSTSRLLCIYRQVPEVFKPSAVHNSHWFNLIHLKNISIQFNSIHVFCQKNQFNSLSIQFKSSSLWYSIGNNMHVYTYTVLSRSYSTFYNVTLAYHQENIVIYPHVNHPRKGQRYTLLLDGGLIKGWGSKDSWLLIVCHDYKIISWHTKGCPPV